MAEETKEPGGDENYLKVGLTELILASKTKSLKSLIDEAKKILKDATFREFLRLNNIKGNPRYC